MQKPLSQPNLQARRRWMLAAYGLLLIIVALTVLIFSLIWLSSKQDDHLAVITNFLTFGTLVLALIAGFVALQAYAAATGLPDLRLKVCFPFSHPNEPGFTVPVVEHGAIVAAPMNQALATISIHNRSGYSAKNPAVIVRLNDVAIAPPNKPSNESWTAIEAASTLGITALQWDGGSVYIHGFSTRILPRLDMRGLRVGVGTPSFTIELLADGYRRLVEIPIEYTSPGEELGDAKMPDWI